MPWKPGESGNLDGPRKTKRFQAAVDRALASDDAYRLRACAERLLDLAAEGEQWAVLLLRDTLDGRPAQQVQAVDGEGRDLAIALVTYNPVSLPATPLPAEDTEQARLGYQEGSSSLAS